MLDALSCGAEEGTAAGPTRRTGPWRRPPARLAAGTPNVAGALGLAAAVDSLQSLGLPAIAPHDDALTRHALDRLAAGLAAATED